MAAKAVVVWGPNGPITGAQVKFCRESVTGPQPIEFAFPLTNGDGYALLNGSLPRQAGYVVALATGYAPAVYPVTLDDQNQEIHFGVDGGPANTIHLPALSFKQSALPAVPVDYPFTGALNIPNAFTYIPYGDNRRQWSTAFGCYSRDWQRQFLDNLAARNYKWQFYQLSGSPYRGDYPELSLDVARIVSDLTYIRSRGFGTIINFRDDVGSDCSYLKPVADATQGLVDCVMGIFESNGVFQGDTEKVVSVLEQQHQLWPKAINAFHSTCQNNELPGFGERAFWEKVSPFVDVYFLQQDAWDFPAASVANRAQDFCERLMNGVAGWPILRRGVVLAEETTTATYHFDWTEHDGIYKMQQLLSMINPRPVGFLDGGVA